MVFRAFTVWLYLSALNSAVALHFFTDHPTFQPLWTIQIDSRSMPTLRFSLFFETPFTSAYIYHRHLSCFISKLLPFGKPSQIPPSQSDLTDDFCNVLCTQIKMSLAKHSEQEAAYRILSTLGPRTFMVIE